MSLYPGHLVFHCLFSSLSSSPSSFNRPLNPLSHSLPLLLVFQFFLLFPAHHPLPLTLVYALFLLLLLLLLIFLLILLLFFLFLLFHLFLLIPCYCFSCSSSL